MELHRSLNVLPPPWLEEHMQYPFPEVELFRGGIGRWRVSVMNIFASTNGSSVASCRACGAGYFVSVCGVLLGWSRLHSAGRTVRPFIE